MTDPKRTRLVLFGFALALLLALAILGGGWAWDGPDDMAVFQLS